VLTKRPGVRDVWAQGLAERLRVGLEVTMAVQLALVGVATLCIAIVNRDAHG
jgi:hypothetical protein